MILVFLVFDRDNLRCYQYKIYTKQKLIIQNILKRLKIKNTRVVFLFVQSLSIQFYQKTKKSQSTPFTGAIVSSDACRYHILLYT